MHETPPAVEVTARAREMLIRELNADCLRYLEVRCRWQLASYRGERLAEIDDRRRLAHNALLSSMQAVARNLRAEVRERAPTLLEVVGNRHAAGRWALRRALELVDGTKAAGDL